MRTSISNIFTGVPPLSTSSPRFPAPPVVRPFCLKSWLYGFIIFVLMTLKYFLP